jgi:hypothetical protein
MSRGNKREQVKLMMKTGQVGWQGSSNLNGARVQTQYISPVGKKRVVSRHSMTVLFN